MDFKKIPSENEESYIRRVCSSKAVIGSWQDVADIINKELGYSYGESAYRKPYQQFEKIFQAEEEKLIDNQAVLEEIKEARRELEYEKVKFRDERNALSKEHREEGRYRANLEILEDVIRSKSDYKIAPVKLTTNSDNDLVVCLSDLHIGAYNDSYFGSYNTEIAAQRLSKYLSKVIEIQKKNNSQDCYVALLGDLINSNIHLTIQISNRENVIKQIKVAAELVSDFCEALSKHFNNVYILNVSGNHSRLGKKDEVLRDERMDDLVPWYMEAKLSLVSNVHIVEDKIDSTIANIIIRGKEYFLVHGDFDSFSESGISKLVMAVGHKPDGVFYGHLHKCSYDDIAGVQIARSGSISSTGDDYCITHRIKGHASQAVCVMTSDGISDFIPIDLE